MICGSSIRRVKGRVGYVRGIVAQNNRRTDKEHGTGANIQQSPVFFVGPCVVLRYNFRTEIMNQRQENVLLL